MNKSEEAVLKINNLHKEIDSSDANDLQKVKMLLQLKDLTTLMMESHLMIAKCKRLLMKHGLIED
jgi:hypothetical protein